MFELTRKCIDVLAESLFETVETIYLVFGAAARLGDDLPRTLLGDDGQFASFRFGLLLGLFNELLGERDHRSHLFGTTL